MTERLPTPRPVWARPSDGPDRPVPTSVPQPPFGPRPLNQDYGLTQSVPNGWQGSGLPLPPPLTPVPFQPDVATPSRSRPSRRPSAYAVSFVVAAVVCAGGLGLLAGRSIAPAQTTGAAGVNGVSGGFNAGRGFPGTLAGASPAADIDGAAAASTGPAGDGQTAAAPTAAPAGDARSAGGFAGRGAGGQQGTVTAMDSAGLTLQLTTGQTLQVTTNADTTYHRRAAGTAADVSVGSQVQIQAAGAFRAPGSFGGQGQAGAAASTPPGQGQAIVATGITVLEQPVAAPTPAPSGGGERGGGFGAGGLQGTVTAVDAAGLTVQLASGQTLEVTTSGDTAYYRRGQGTATDVTMGSQVLVQMAGAFGRSGGFGQGAAVASAAPGSAPAAASDITVLEP